MIQSKVGDGKRKIKRRKSQKIKTKLKKVKSRSAITLTTRTQTARDKPIGAKKSYTDHFFAHFTALPNVINSFSWRNLVFYRKIYKMKLAESQVALLRS